MQINLVKEGGEILKSFFKFAAENSSHLALHFFHAPLAMKATRAFLLFCLQCHAYTSPKARAHQDSVLKRFFAKTKLQGILSAYLL